jgi:two-component system OmpR family sensor kinase
MHFSSWTLRSRLIGLTVLLVAVVALVMGGVLSVVVMNAFTSRFNSEVQQVAQGYGRTPQGFSTARGQYAEAGTIIVAFDGDGTVEGLYVKSTTSEAQPALTSKQIAEIRAAFQSAQNAPDRARDVRIDDYGVYKMSLHPYISSSGQQGVIAAGKPVSDLNKEIASVLVPIAVVVALVILLAGLLGALIVGSALRPLRRVAAIASDVASLPLERGDVELPERVPTEDTNPHTEVGQVGAALNNLLDSVQTALAVRQASEEKVRHFVADASHELRTPLASIRGYAELTRRFGGPLTEDVQHNIGRIESEAMRMTSLVEDLLLLARLDAERELETQDVDLSRMLVDVLSDANAAGPDHEWELDLPDEPVTVRGDEAKLQQVFTNLLANARVHTPAGTRVVLELAAPKDGHVLARVRDNGPGIPEKLRPQLFGRFVRGDSSRARSTGSTGLGLAIVNAVVQAHHGTVSVASEPGATVFTVQLPVEQPAVVKEPQQEHQPA